MSEFNACPPFLTRSTPQQHSLSDRAPAQWTSLRGWSALAGMLTLSACPVDSAPQDDFATQRSVDTATTAGGYSTYIALGDSYSSANGVANDFTVCLRGMGAWPHLLQPKLPLQDPSKLAVLEACSGATTAGILGTEQGMAPQINSVTSIAPQVLESALITITIGGNDIGVAAELANCLETDCTSNEMDILKKIADTRVKLFNVYDALRKAAPKATIVAVGYPHLVAANATFSCTGNDPTAEIELTEREMIRRTIDVMNATIAAAAKDAKISWIINEVVAAFEGREACAGTGADLIHRVEAAGLPFGIFHQNAAGNEAYSEAVLKGLSGLVPSVSAVARPASAPAAAPGVTPTPSATPIPGSTPTSHTTPIPGSATTPIAKPTPGATPIPGSPSTANPKPATGTKPIPGSAATSTSKPGENDSDSEADSDEDSAETDGEEADGQDEDGIDSDGDGQDEDGTDSEGEDEDGIDSDGDGQDEDGTDSEDDGQGEDDSGYEDDGQYDDSGE